MVHPQAILHFPKSNMLSWYDFRLFNHEKPGLTWFATPYIHFF